MSRQDPEQKAPPDVTTERFDDLLQRLRTLVEKLESGNLPLEESLRCFEEGMLLCRKGAEILDRAEKRVEVLLTGPGNTVKTAPLDPPAPSDENR